MRREAIFTREGFLRKKAFKETPEVLDAKKGNKLDSLDGLYITVNGVKYDAHETALANMNGVLNKANHIMIKEMVKVLPELQPLYDAIYKSTIEWKGYDNKPHTVQVESIAEAIESIMSTRAGIYGV